MRHTIIMVLGLAGWLAPACAQDTDRVPAEEASDAAALEVLRQVCDVYARATSMSYEAQVVTYLRGHEKDRLEAKAQIALEKPNLLRIDVSSDHEALPAMLVCDGESVWESRPDPAMHTRSQVPSDPAQVIGRLGGLPFFGRQVALAKDPYAAMTAGGSIYTCLEPETVDGIECHVLRLASPSGWSMRIWVDKKRSLVLKTQLDYTMGKAQRVQVTTRSKILLDPRLSPDIFRFEPSPGSKLVPGSPAGEVPVGG